MQQFGLKENWCKKSQIFGVKNAKILWLKIVVKIVVKNWCKKLSLVAIIFNLEKRRAW